MLRPDALLTPTPKGLYCPPGDFYIDPVAGAVDRAVVTHGHADHARRGHGKVLATPATLAIMKARYGDDMAVQTQALEFGETVEVDGVTVWFSPAGHVLGSAQAVVEYRGLRMVCTGDYKRRPDPTCRPFEVVEGVHVFITEATFGLPVFRHPDPYDEMRKLLASRETFPEKTHLVGAYALGKAQRVIRMLRELGHDDPIFIHGAMQKLCDLYQAHGIDLGRLEPATLPKGRGSGADREQFRGHLVVAPPAAIQDRWGRRFPDPVPAFASGWMRVRARARQRGVELPLIISDHADWDELTTTIEEVDPEEVWVTHGREDALVRWAELQGRKARPLRLVGYDDEDADGDSDRGEGAEKETEPAA